MELAFAAERPVYIRIGKCDIGPVHEEPIKYQWGELIEMRRGMATSDLSQRARWYKRLLTKLRVGTEAAFGAHHRLSH